MKPAVWKFSYSPAIWLYHCSSLALALHGIIFLVSILCWNAGPLNLELVFWRDSYYVVKVFQGLQGLVIFMGIGLHLVLPLPPCLPLCFHVTCAKPCALQLASMSCPELLHWCNILGDQADADGALVQGPVSDATRNVWRCAIAHKVVVCMIICYEARFCLKFTSLWTHFCFLNQHWCRIGCVEWEKKLELRKLWGCCFLLNFVS